MTPNYRELLRTPSDVARDMKPKALPGGHWICEVKSHEFGQSKRKKTWYVRFNLVPLAPTSDVSGDTDGLDLSAYEGSLRKDYFITPKALYRLVNMLDSVLGEDNREVEERIPDMNGQRIMVSILERLDDEGNPSEYNDVGDDLVSASADEHAAAAAQ